MAGFGGVVGFRVSAAVRARVPFVAETSLATRTPRAIFGRRCDVPVGMEVCGSDPPSDPRQPCATSSWLLTLLRRDEGVPAGRNVTGFTGSAVRLPGAIEDTSGIKRTEASDGPSARTLPVDRCRTTLGAAVPASNGPLLPVGESVGLLAARPSAGNAGSGRRPKPDAAPNDTVEGRISSSDGGASGSSPSNDETEAASSSCANVNTAPASNRGVNPGVDG